MVMAWGMAMATCGKGTVMVYILQRDSDGLDMEKVGMVMILAYILNSGCPFCVCVL